MDWYIVGLGLGLLINIVAVVYKYGKLNSSVEDNSKKIDNYTNEMVELKNNIGDLKSMEVRVINLEKLHKEVADISATLNQLVGKIDLFLKMWEVRLGNDK